MAANPRVRTKGVAMSFKIIAKPFDNFSGSLNFKNDIEYRAADTGTNAGCTRVDTVNPGGNMAQEPSATANLPISNTNFPFYFTIRAYLNSIDCDDNQVYKDIIFQRKVFSAIDFQNNKLEAKGHLDTTNNDRQVVFVKTTPADVCGKSFGTYSGGGTQDTEFASGFGQAGSPYLICDGVQLSKIEAYQGVSNITQPFRLGRDIDLHPLTSFLAMPNASPIPCTSGGETFIPIGGYDLGYPELNEKCGSSGPFPINTSANTGSVFTGTFDGDGHTISHLRVQSDKFQNIGFIRRIGTGGRLVDISFDKAEIQGDFNVGIIGSINTGNPIIHLENIKIKNSYFEARNTGNNNNVGALLGNGKQSTGVNAASVIKDIVVEKTRVEGEFNSIGGVIGIARGFGTVENIFFDGTIDCEGTCNVVGGVIGELENASAQSIRSKGLIRGHGSGYGGVIGYLSGTGNLVEDTYSQMYIDIRNNAGTNYQTGGLIGSIQGSTNTLRNSYFGGFINHDCDGSAITTGCRIGNGVGLLVGGNTANNIHTFSRMYNDFAESTFLPATTAGQDDLGGSAVTKSTYGFFATVSAGRTSLFNGTAASQFNEFNTNWDNVAASPGLPRLVNEPSTRCDEALSKLSVNLQLNNGRGQSGNNPVIICRVDQFKDMLVLNTTKKYFELGDSINIGADGNVVATEHPDSFPHQLDGNNFIIFDIANDHATIDPANSAGLINSIASSGVIKNLVISNIRTDQVTSYSTTATYGLLAGTNNGIIDNVILAGVMLNPSDYTRNIGLMIGKNNGIIRNSKVHGVLYARDYVGGVVSDNVGDILRVEANVKIKVSDDTSMTTTAMGGSYIGGIASKNSGDIDEVKFDGNISSIIDTDFAGIAGGLIGENNGNLQNSYVSDEAFIILGQGSSITQVGGAVGNNTGNIDKIYSAARVISDDYTNLFNDNIQGLVGDNSGGVTNSYFYSHNLFEEKYDNAFAIDNFQCLTDSNDDYSFQYDGSLGAFNSTAASINDPVIRLEDGPDSYDFIRLTNALNPLTTAATDVVVNTTNATDLNTECNQDQNLSYASPNEVFIYEENIPTTTYGTKRLSYYDMGDIDLINALGFDIVDFENLSAEDLTRIKNYYNQRLTQGTIDENSQIWDLPDEYPRLPRLLRLDSN